jgi:hypothetical protein
MPPKYQHQHQFSLLEHTLKKNQNQSRVATPKIRLASPYIPFNIDEKRIEKLEKKLFGEPIRKQSRFSVNGEDWKNDRETLVEIMCSIKSPPKRHSAHLINEVAGLAEKMEGQAKRETATKVGKEKPEELCSPVSVKDTGEDEKAMMMKSLLYRYAKESRAKK